MLIGNESIDVYTPFLLYYNYKKGGIIIDPSDYLLKKGENFFKSKNPLKIKLAQIEYRGFGGIMGRKNCNIILCLDINFANITDKKINVIIKDIDFCPKETIDFLKFEYRKGMRTGLKFSYLQTNFQIDPGDTLFYFWFTIRTAKPFNKNDFDSFKNIPMIFKIKHSVSPKFQERIYKEELENFFKDVHNLCWEKVSSPQYKKFFEDNS